MNLPFNIARRYFFGKKSTNAINIITAISVTGVALGTGALLLVMSVFNGFEDLIKSLYNSFQPDILVTPKEGKVFSIPDDTYTQLRAVNGVAHVSGSLEEISFFEYKNRQDFGVLKGVDTAWVNVTRLDSVIYEGLYRLDNGTRHFAVIGYQIRNKLGISVDDHFTELSVYMLKNKKVGPFEQPFRKQFLQPAGIFSIQQQFDEKYIISDLAFAQRLRGYKKGEVSQLEIKFEASADKKTAISTIQDILGEGYEVKDRFRQNEAFFKLMQVEKWMGFAITGLTMILVAINMVGCMFMLIHEKKKDIAILKSMGADSSFIRKIFLWVGLIMCGMGMIIGTVTAGVLYILQKTVVIIPMEGFIVDAYPMSFRFVDLFATIVFVLIFGVLFAYYPANRASRIKSLVRDE